MISIRTIIYIVFSIVISGTNVYSQDYYQVLGFENGYNAVMTITKGEIGDDSFVVSFNIDWTNKNGKNIKQDKLGILLTNNNLDITPSTSVKCLSTRNNDVFISKSGNLHFEILETYTGEQIIIAFNPTFVKDFQKKHEGTNLSPLVFSIPEKLDVSYQGYSEKPPIKTIIGTPDLIIKNEFFTDIDSNNIINAFERSELVFEVENIGNGIAETVMVRSSHTNSNVGISFEEESIQLGDILPNEKKTVAIPIYASKSISSGVAEFKIEVLENRGFDAFPLSVKIETREFQEPNIKVMDAVFSTEDGGMIKRNYPVNLRLLVQNIGKGSGKEVSLKLNLPKSKFLIPFDSDYYELNNLASGETKVIDFSFTATRRYNSDIVPFRVEIKEKHQLYAKDTLLVLDLQEELLSMGEVVIKSTPKTKIVQVSPASLSSNVDRNIPVNILDHPERWALIIGNEEYTKYQPSIEGEINVDFARNDARVFKEYLINTFGFIEDQVILLLDATKGEMEQKIDLITKLSSKYGSTSEIVFYYAGHGLPDENTRESFLIPVDITGSNFKSGIKLSDLYNKLGQADASKITVFLDACFSGGSRKGALLASRSVSIKPKKEVLTGNMVVFTASSNTQASLPYRQKYHGMFTYFLLKKFQETRGYINYGELADYLIYSVGLESLKINEKEQDPKVVVSQSIQDGWRSWNFIN